MKSNSFDIKQLTGRIGAEILGLDLTKELTKDLIRDIRQTLLQYKVIFFRNQNLDAQGQISFARNFGEVTKAHPTAPSLPDHPEVFDLNYNKTTNYANNWHTDTTFLDRPPLGYILRILEVPPVGGDTLWANTVTAYQDLPIHLRCLADQLWAVHTNANNYVTPAINLANEAINFRTIPDSNNRYETLHPVVRVHPESGERGLFIDEFVHYIQGLSTSESINLVQLFQSYVTRPENTVRWRWQLGDIAFWDNRVTQHYAIADYGNHARRVQRVTIAGDIPVNIEGKPSVVIKGDSSEFTQYNTPNFIGAKTVE